MGGHVAEKLFIGDKLITSGCSSDLEKATKIATHTVRQCGMFGKDASYIYSNESRESSEKQNALVDSQVREILDESYLRVQKLLLEK